MINKNMDLCPHIDLYEGDQKIDHMVNELYRDIASDCWCVASYRQMTLRNYNEIWDSCMENPHKICKEKYGHVYFNRYNQENDNPQVRSTLMTPGGCEAHILPYLLSGNSVVLYLGRDVFCIRVYKKLKDTFGGPMFIRITVYRSSFSRPNQLSDTPTENINLSPVLEYLPKPADQE